MTPGFLFHDPFAGTGPVNRPLTGDLFERANVRPGRGSQPIAACGAEA